MAYQALEIHLTQIEVFKRLGEQGVEYFIFYTNYMLKRYLEYSVLNSLTSLLTDVFCNVATRRF